MRNLLYVGINVDSVSPSGAEMVIRTIGGAANTEYFGPGFTDSIELEAGLKAFCIKKEYDIIFICHSALYNCSSVSGAVKLSKTFDIHNTNPELLAKVCATLLNDALSLSAPKILCIWEDYWSLTKEYLYTVENTIKDKNGIYLFGEHPDFVACRDQAPGYNNERIGSLFSDDYYYFAQKYRNIFIPALHTIGEQYFNFSPLTNRAEQWAIVGRDYEPRTIAKSKLRKAHVIVKDNAFFVFLMRALSFLGFRPYSKLFLLSEYQRRYFKCLDDSKYAFCCGMRIKTVVSKFFELPAKGCLMVCYPCMGISRLGFINGYNAFFCEPEHVLDCYETLKQRDDLQVIVNRGQDLVWKNHSLHARIGQFSKVINIIVEGKFNGAYWDNGEFIINSK